MKPTKDWVVLVIAVALGTALNLVTAGVLYDAIFSEGPGLSDNAVQLLTGWGGGMVGIIGAYVGYRVGTQQHASGSPPEDDPAIREEPPP
ncbi:MAG TPA: hypothetical protein VH912_24160 [Streptosporangiaceae bacterium]